LYSQWEHWLPNDETTSDTFKRAGYYAKNVTDRLRVIALNTNLCSRENYWQLYDPRDQGDQLSWLAEQLTTAEMAGQHVHLVGHIPPSSECTETWLHNYMKLLDRFATTITGSWFGHTHNDEIRVYYPTDKNAGKGDSPTQIGFVGGSITTFGHVNPCYKIYTIDENQVRTKIALLY